MSVTLWPTSEYAARCDRCAGGIPSDQPRIRDDEKKPLMLGKRSWHPECYHADNEPEGQPRIPRSGAAPRGGRGERPTSTTAAPSSSSTAPEATPSGPTSDSTPRSASYPPREAGWTWVTVEESTASEDGAHLCRLARLVPSDRVPTEQASLRSQARAAVVPAEAPRSTAVPLRGETAEDREMARSG